jgi:hypothetical protein
MEGIIYHEQKDYAFAHQLWEKEGQLFELQERQRLSRLSKDLEDNPPFNGLIMFLFLCVTGGSIAVGFSHGVGACGLQA